MDTPEHPRLAVQAANRALHRETLLSYRLLFGQDSKSRQMFRNVESKKARDKDSSLDPLSERLCGDKEKIDSLITDHSIREFSYYDNQDDFHFYGPRLLLLQRSAGSQNPRTFSNIWHDRRNLAQWLTVCLVTLLTAVTIILSIVQIGLGIAQVKLAIQ